MKGLLMKEEKLYSPQEFAERLSISRWTVYSWLHDGRIEGVKIGRLVRIEPPRVFRRLF